MWCLDLESDAELYAHGEEENNNAVNIPEGYEEGESRDEAEEQLLPDGNITDAIDTYDPERCSNLDPARPEK